MDKFAEQSKELMLPEHMVKVISKIKSALNSQGIKYLVIGGIAVGKYSAPRTTADIDFLIQEEDFQKVASLFGDYSTLEVADRDAYSFNIDDVDVDFMIASDNEGFMFDNPNTYTDFNVPHVFSLLYLKLKTGRTKDISDVVQMTKKLSKQEREAFVKFLNGKKRLIDPSIIEDFKQFCALADFEANKKTSGKASRALILKTIRGKIE